MYKDEDLEFGKEEVEVSDEHTEEESSDSSKEDPSESSGETSDVPVDEEGEFQAEQKASDTKKPRDFTKTKLNQALRDKYHYQDQARKYEEAIRQQQEEIMQLRQLNNYAAQNSFSQYESHALERMDVAKQNLARAIEAGDADAQAKAQIEITNATTDYKEANKRRIEQEIYNQQEMSQYQQNQQPQQYDQYFNQPQYQSQPQYQAQDYTSEWVQNNLEWTDPSSPGYDPYMVDRANQIARELNTHLKQNNGAHFINTQQYWDEIDKRISEESSRPRAPVQRQPQNYGYQPQYEQPRRELNMKPTRTPVAPARSGYRPPQGQSNSRMTRPLPPLVNELAQKMGVSEKSYREALSKDRQQYPDRWGRN